MIASWARSAPDQEFGGVAKPIAQWSVRGGPRMAGRLRAAIRERCANMASAETGLLWMVCYDLACRIPTEHVVEMHCSLRHGPERAELELRLTIRDGFWIVGDALAEAAEDAVGVIAAADGVELAVDDGGPNLVRVTVSVC